MGTVARPLSAEQELATQQPPHTRHPATTLQLNITTSSQLCHQDINTTTTNNMDAPQNLDPTGLYQSAASCSAQPTKSNTICSQPPHHCQDASAGPHRPLLSQDAPVPLPSDPVIGMLHPGIFLASTWPTAMETYNLLNSTMTLPKPVFSKSPLGVTSEEDLWREAPWTWIGRAEFFQSISSTKWRQIKRRNSTQQEDTLTFI